MTMTSRKGRAKSSTDMEKEEAVGAEEKPVRKPAPKQKKVIAAKSLKSSAPLKTGQSAAESEMPRKPARRGKIANETDKAAKTDKVAKTDKAVKAVRDVELDKADKTDITANSTPKKNKLRHDSYSIPENEHKQLAVLKKRCADQGRPIKKSYLLRAGIQALTRMNDNEFFNAIERIK
ncbi:hypothetical protein SAMN05216299_10182 [Nitrosospira sp. Nsp14]|nr:hypothetical protein SAMN05216299_10182 [Nitrosospira sp. Nsp14]